MKNKILFRISLPVFIILLSGFFIQSDAQVIVSSKTEKKLNSDIFPTDRKRTSPLIINRDTKRIYPVLVKNKRDLPPGHAKKIYGEKSAKTFAPGQTKKAYDTNFQYNKNRKHLHKKWKRQHHKNKKD